MLTRRLLLPLRGEFSVCVFCLTVCRAFACWPWPRLPTLLFCFEREVSILLRRWSVERKKTCAQTVSNSSVLEFFLVLSVGWVWGVGITDYGLIFRVCSCELSFHNPFFEFQAHKSSRVVLDVDCFRPWGRAGTMMALPII